MSGTMRDIHPPSLRCSLTHLEIGFLRLSGLPESCSPKVERMHWSTSHGDLLLHLESLKDLSCGLVKDNTLELGLEPLD
jgi:hypothetical protein